MRDDDGVPERVFRAARAGDPHAEAVLIERFYSDFRKIARTLMARERKGHTLQPTALVNEAFPRIKNRLKSVHDRRHLMRMARSAMMQCLTDYARRRNAAKRRPEGILVEEEPRCPFDDLELDIRDALDDLAAFKPRACAVLEYSRYLGMSVPEAALQLDISVSSAEADLRFARAFLGERLVAYG